MPSAQKTPNYNLTQYAANGSDKISFMGDYNSDMSKIDTQLNVNANNIIGKANSTDVYTKAQIDASEATQNTEIAAKANSTDV